MMTEAPPGLKGILKNPAVTLEPSSSIIIIPRKEPDSLDSHTSPRSSDSTYENHILNGYVPTNERISLTDKLSSTDNLPLGDFVPEGERVSINNKLV